MLKVARILGKNEEILGSIPSRSFSANQYERAVRTVTHGGLGVVLNTSGPSQMAARAAAVKAVV